MQKNRNDKVLKNFGEKLKGIRKGKNLSTRELADLTEIALSQVWALETGRGNPGLTTLIAVAGALGVSLNEFDPRK